MLRQDWLQNSFKVFAASTGTVIKSFRFPITLEVKNTDKKNNNRSLIPDKLKARLYKQKGMIIGSDICTVCMSDSLETEVAGFLWGDIGGWRQVESSQTHSRAEELIGAFLLKCGLTFLKNLRAA